MQALSSSTAAFRAAKWSEWGLGAESYLLIPDEDHKLYACEIEIESEGMSYSDAMHTINNMPATRWQIKSEGSLRGDGFELVSNGPMPRDTLLMSLAQVLPMLEGICDTFRAAVHVHCNVRHATREQYARIAVGYYINEPSIYEFVGDGRDESVFCVPWSKGSAHVHDLLRAYFDDSSFGWAQAVQSSPKYSGLNLGATHTYGSVEFRHLQTPAMSNPACIINRIAEYIHMCAGIVEGAMRPIWNGHDLLEYASYMMDVAPKKLTSQQTCDVYSSLACGRKIDVLTQGVPASTVSRLSPRRRLRRPMPSITPADAEDRIREWAAPSVSVGIQGEVTLGTFYDELVSDESMITLDLGE